MRFLDLQTIGKNAAAVASLTANPESELLREPNLVIPYKKPTDCRTCTVLSERLQNRAWLQVAD